MLTMIFFAKSAKSLSETCAGFALPCIIMMVCALVVTIISTYRENKKGSSSANSKKATVSTWPPTSTTQKRSAPDSKRPREKKYNLPWMKIVVGIIGILLYHLFLCGVVVSVLRRVSPDLHEQKNTEVRREQARHEKTRDAQSGNGLTHFAGVSLHKHMPLKGFTLNEELSSISEDWRLRCNFFEKISSVARDETFEGLDGFDEMSIKLNPSSHRVGSISLVKYCSNKQDVNSSFSTYLSLLKERYRIVPEKVGEDNVLQEDGNEVIYRSRRIRLGQQIRINVTSRSIERRSPTQSEHVVSVTLYVDNEWDKMMYEQLFRD